MSTNATLFVSRALAFAALIAARWFFTSSEVVGLKDFRAVLNDTTLLILKKMKFSAFYVSENGQ
jgi:hypothetical protein